MIRQQGRDRRGDSDDIVLITGSHPTSVARVGLGAQGFTHAVSASPHDDPVRAASVCPSPDPLPRPGPAGTGSRPGRSGTCRWRGALQAGARPAGERQHHLHAVDEATRDQRGQVTKLGNSTAQGDFEAWALHREGTLCVPLVPLRGVSTEPGQRA